MGDTVSLLCVNSASVPKPGQGNSDSAVDNRPSAPQQLLAVERRFGSLATISEEAEDNESTTQNSEKHYPRRAQAVKMLMWRRPKARKSQ